MMGLAKSEQIGTLRAQKKRAMTRQKAELSSHTP